MTPDAFLPAVESSLRARGGPFARADLLAFAGCCCRLMRDDADPPRFFLLFAERLAEAGMRVAGSVASTDGIERAVYDEGEGRQHVISPEGRPVHGRWLAPADEPVILEGSAPGH